MVCGCVAHRKAWSVGMAHLQGVQFIKESMVWVGSVGWAWSIWEGVVCGRVLSFQDHLSTGTVPAPRFLTHVMALPCAVHKLASH